MLDPPTTPSSHPSTLPPSVSELTPMDVNTHEADELETGITSVSSFKDTDLSITATYNAAETSDPMPGSSLLHTEQQESQAAPADVEMQPDEELSAKEAGTDDEEKNAVNTTH
jgi:hypothetical protein